jgi:hypothetical protein
VRQVQRPAQSVAQSSDAPGTVARAICWLFGHSAWLEIQLPTAKRRSMQLVCARCRTVVISHPARLEDPAAETRRRSIEMLYGISLSIALLTAATSLAACDRLTGVPPRARSCRSVTPVWAYIRDSLGRKIDSSRGSYMVVDECHGQQP